jgi:hypothetical protein
MPVRVEPKRLALDNFVPEIYLQNSGLVKG